MQVFGFSAILYHISIAVIVGAGVTNYYPNIWMLFGFIKRKAESRDSAL